jgi:hypothetical protein
MVKLTNRQEALGTIRVANEGFERLTSSGVDFDRSMYACISDDVPPA